MKNTMNNVKLPNEVILKLEENGFFGKDFSSESKESSSLNKNEIDEMFIKQISSKSFFTVATTSENCFILFYETSPIAYSVFLQFSTNRHKNVFVFLDQIFDFLCSCELLGNYSKLISFKLNEEIGQKKPLIFEGIDEGRNKLLIFYEDNRGKHYLLSETDENTSLLTTSTNNK